MKTTAPARQRRVSAEERREEILDAAVHEFAQKGLHGTSTETIAQRVGISQPYLFRLFGTKKDLFLATVERGFDRVRETFRIAAEAHPEEPMQAMGEAYGELVGHRDALLLQLQSYAACADPDIQPVVRRRFADLYQFVEQVSGAPEEEVSEFFAHGMLLNVAAAMNLPEIHEAWVGRCLGFID